MPLSGTSTPEIRVLHVDDEPALADVVAQFLEKFDDQLTVTTETTAEAALDRLFNAEERFDCIVSDYDMPGMNGQEFLEAVRAKRPNLPFILFTGKGSEDIASNAISAGVTDYLKKGSGTDQYQLLANQINNAVSRWRTRTRLQRVREQTNVLLEDSPVMITVSIDGVCTFINKAGVDLLEADSQEAIVGRNFLDFVHPADGDREATPIFLSDTEREAGAANLERELTTESGATKYVEVTARPITFDGEDAVLAIVKDISDRKRRERQLREREQRYRAMAENFPKGMVLLFDEDLRFTVAKGQGLADVGLESYDLEGRTIFEGLPADLCALFEPRYRRALEGEEDVFELEYDGHVFRVHTLPIRDKDGTVFAGMQIAPDITDERQQAEALQEKNDRLAEFSSVISHDLQNPLEAARGHLRLARDSHDSEALQQVDKSLERMDGLITNVLSLARSGLTIDTVEPVALRPIIEDAWRQVESNGTSMEIDQDLTIEADPSRVREMVGNLFRNTIEHAETERRIRVGELDDGFFIEDDGIGIAKSEREKVFETGHTTTTDGTGFGLAIVRQIAEAHGWTVDITESPGGGTQFNISNVTILGS